MRDNRRDWQVHNLQSPQSLRHAYYCKATRPLFGHSLRIPATVNIRAS